MKESLPQVARKLLAAVRLCYDALPAIREHVWGYEQGLYSAIASLVETLSGVFCECATISDPYYSFGPEPGPSVDAFAAIEKFVEECDGFLARREEDPDGGCPFGMMQVRGETLMYWAYEAVRRRSQAEQEHAAQPEKGKEGNSGDT